MKIAIQSTSYAFRIPLLALAMVGSLAMCKSKDIKKVAVEGGKMTAPVKLSYLAPAKTAVGETAEIVFFGTATGDLDKFEVSVSIPGQVKLISGNNRSVSSGKVSSGSKLQGSIRIKSDSEGRHVLNLQGKTQLNDIKLMSVTPLYFQVGDSEKLIDTGRVIKEGNRIYKDIKVN